MKKATIELHAEDSLIQETPFKHYRSNVARRAVQYLPKSSEPEEIDIQTPWGEVLVCSRGDYIVSEMDKPDDRWPVSAEIFEDTYVQIRPGIYIKRATTELAPLVDFTNGNPEVQVIVHTLEGTVKVRAGDFYLAHGTRGEIWPVPSEKVDQMIQVDEEGSAAGQD